MTHKDVYPLPRIDDILDALQGAKYFCSIDLASGYWQIKVADKDREKTAIGSHLGLYEFLCMPFGLTGAPATFSRLMDKVLDGLIGKSCLVYLNDVIIYGMYVCIAEAFVGGEAFDFECRVPTNIIYKIPKVESSYVLRELKAMSANKATGIDGITSCSLNAGAPVICDSLAFIMKH